MIRVEALDHRDAAVAARIIGVWRPAYAQEATLLGAHDFPPLQRQPADVQASDDFFLGATDGDALHGVLCIGPDDEAGQLAISALVVHPAQQRRGIARALMQQALARAPDLVFAVSTGAANTPALALVQGLGFTIYRHGVIGPESLPLVKLRRDPAVRPNTPTPPHT